MENQKLKPLVSTQILQNIITVSHLSKTGDPYFTLVFFVFSDESGSANHHVYDLLKDGDAPDDEVYILLRAFSGFINSGFGPPSG